MWILNSGALVFRGWSRKRTRARNGPEQETGWGGEDHTEQGPALIRKDGTPGHMQTRDKLSKHSLLHIIITDVNLFRNCNLWEMLTYIKLSFAKRDDGGQMIAVWSMQSSSGSKIRCSRSMHIWVSLLAPQFSCNPPDYIVAIRLLIIQFALTTYSVLILLWGISLFSILTFVIR